MSKKCEKNCECRKSCACKTLKWIILIVLTLGLAYLIYYFFIADDCEDLDEDFFNAVKEPEAVPCAEVKEAEKPAEAVKEAEAEKDAEASEEAKEA